MLQPLPDPATVILIDKPLTWTSFGVVKKLKYAGKFRKIGHAGTLDPLATGLLILCTGKKTKEIEQYQAQEKEYTGSLVFGYRTASVDLETEIEPVGTTDHLTAELVQDYFQRFTGEVTQVPPAHSAIKINGQRAYKAARRGETVALKARTVHVPTFELTSFSTAQAQVVASFRIVCSKGTYIRSLVRDVGEAAGCGAYMQALRRTRIGSYSVIDAVTPEQWIQTAGGHAGIQ